MGKTVNVIELLAESDHSWEDAASVALEQAKKLCGNPIHLCREFHGGGGGRRN